MSKGRKAKATEYASTSYLFLGIFMEKATSWCENQVK